MTSQTDTDHIHTSDASPGEVLITLTYPQGGGARHATLRIEDGMSGETLIDVDLTPEQFLAMMSTTATRVYGARLSDHPERFGKRMENTSTRISHRADLDAEAERVRDAYLADGWEQTRIDRTNFGRRVVAYRWIADEQAGAAVSETTTKE